MTFTVAIFPSQSVHRLYCGKRFGSVSVFWKQFIRVRYGLSLSFIMMLGGFVLRPENRIIRLVEIKNLPYFFVQDGNTDCSSNLQGAFVAAGLSILLRGFEAYSHPIRISIRAGTV
jgi:hypothetical protein